MSAGWPAELLASLEAFLPTTPASGIHLAVLRQPYLTFILTGQKTIESRFSTRRMPPYRRVESGDSIILKEASGPIRGIATVHKVVFLERPESGWHGLRRRYAAGLCATNDDFWAERREKDYATLLFLSKVRLVPSCLAAKRDRRAWVVLQPRLTLFT